MKKDQMRRAVIEYLDSQDWGYEEPKDGTILVRNMGIRPCKLKHVNTYVMLRDSAMSINSIFPMNADIEHPQEIMEYLARANYGLRIGNFDMDLSDGEIRFVAYVKYPEGNSIPQNVIERNFDIGFKMFRKYGDGIAALALGFSDAKTEIKKAEG